MSLTSEKADAVTALLDGNLDVLDEVLRRLIVRAVDPVELSCRVLRVTAGAAIAEKKSRIEAGATR